MDSLDSSSSSLSAFSTSSAAAKRDGEDDLAVYALARDAAGMFESGKYDECVKVLNQLSEKQKKKKGDDLKILHNLAIAEFFRDGCSNMKKLLDTLKLVKKKCEELSRAEEQMEPNTPGNKSLASKGNSTLNQLSATNTSSVAYIDEFDSSVATYNIALLWFHHHEYSRVLSILDSLYHYIQPIDEATALKICLLLLDASLACQDASRSADVFHYLEKTFGAGCSGTQGDSGGAAQQQSTNLGAKSSSLSSGSIVDASSLDQTASANSSENLSTLSEDSLESMLKSFGNSGHNIGRPAGVKTSNDISRNTADRSISVFDLKLKLQLYKVQLLLLTRSLKVAKREVKHAVNVARGKDSSMALLLKSQIEHARGNHSKAIKLLTASNNTTEIGFLIMFYNNLGCIYHHLGKSYESSVLFSKALKSCTSFRKEGPQKLSTLLHGKSLLILYNCGIQYLNGGKPILAARCFQKASLVFYNRPLFWLRFAECSLMALEKGLVTAESIASDKSEIRVNVIGKGKWRQLAVKDALLTKGLVDIGNNNGVFLGKDGAPRLSLSSARQCIYNALHLLNCSGSNSTESSLPSNPSMVENQPNDAASYKNLNQNSIASVDLKISTVSSSLGHVNVSADAKEQKGGTSQENVQSSVCLYEEACKRENMMLNQIVLSNLAFIELELENPLKALSVARSLLEVPGCSRIMTFIGHVYAAEALCLLNRLKEAAELLSVYLSGENKVKMPYSQKHLEQWRVEKIVDCEEFNSSMSGKPSYPEDLQHLGFLRPETAQGTLIASFATMAALQGKLVEARHFVSQALSIIPDHPNISLTAVYVDLMLGDLQGAISRLRKCKHVNFLPSSLSLEKANL